MKTEFFPEDFRDSKNRPVQKPKDAVMHWRPSVYAAITSPDHPGCVLMVQAGDGTGSWQFPGGGVEIDEPLVEGLKREVREETGYDSVIFSSEMAWVSERAFYSSQN